MEKKSFEGNWKEFKGKVQSKWGELTDDNEQKLKGNLKELVATVEKSYGKSKNLALKKANKILKKLNNKLS